MVNYKKSKVYVGIKGIHEKYFARKKASLVTVDLKVGTIDVLVSK